MVTGPQAYLLWKMRAKGEVARVLAREGMNPNDLQYEAQQAAKLLALDRPRHDASVYTKTVGPPACEETLVGENLPPVFAGSISRFYRMPLWPKVLFRVNQHPSGYAWGETFVGRPASVPLPALSAIKPWEWVIETLEPAATKLEILEHWDDQKDLKMTFCCGGTRFVYLAKFDFGLLQEWQRIEE